MAALPATATQQIQALNTTISQIDTQAAAQTAATGAMKTPRLPRLKRQGVANRALSPSQESRQAFGKGNTRSDSSPELSRRDHRSTVAQLHAALAATTAAVQTVAPYKHLFIARGLSVDFMEQLTTQATALSAAMQASGTAKTTRVATTKDLAQLLEELRSTMHVLELAVTKVCRADRVTGPTTLFAWKRQDHS